MLISDKDLSYYCQDVDQCSYGAHKQNENIRVMQLQLEEVSKISYIEMMIMIEKEAENECWQ